MGSHLFLEHPKPILLVKLVKRSNGAVIDLMNLPWEMFDDTFE